MFNTTNILKLNCGVVKQYSAPKGIFTPVIVLIGEPIRIQRPRTRYEMQIRKEETGIIQQSNQCPLEGSQKSGRASKAHHRQPTQFRTINSITVCCCCWSTILLFNGNLVKGHSLKMFDNFEWKKLWLPERFIALFYSTT